jgi:hypothetical protein
MLCAGRRARLKVRVRNVSDTISAEIMPNNTVTWVETSRLLSANTVRIAPRGILYANHVVAQMNYRMKA